MAAPTYKFGSTSTGAGSVTVGFGGTPVAGDLIVIVANYSANSAQTVNPTGFTLGSRAVSKGTFFEVMDIYMRVFQTGDPTTATVTTTSNNTAVVSAVYTGTDQVNPFDVVQSTTFNDNVDRSTVSAPGVTSPHTPNITVLRIFGNTPNGAVSPTLSANPAGVTSRGNALRSFTGVYVYEDTPRAEGSPVSATWNNSGSLAATTLVLKDPATRPNAPQLTTPANGNYVDLAAAVNFRYTFVDPNPADTQASYAFRRKVGAGAYEYWNASTAAFQTTEVFNALTAANNSTVTVAFGAGKWTNGTTYQWSAAARDQTGLTSPYQSDSTVTGSVPPVVTVTSPTGTVSNTDRPPAVWTYTDTENSPQVTYQVRYFTAAQYGIAGFDPGSSPAFWDSGVIANSATRSVTPGIDLTNNTTYRVYVQSQQIGNQFSAFALSQFTLSLTPPNAPTLATDYDRINNRTVLTVTGNDLSGTYTIANTKVTVERSDNNGLTWTPVRGGSSLTLNASRQAVVFDYEAPTGTRLYRAITRGTI